jgi:hypothetical protein
MERRGLERKAEGGEEDSHVREKWIMEERDGGEREREELGKGEREPERVT